MDSIKIDLPPQQVKAVFMVLEKVISIEPDSRGNALLNIIFTRLYIRLRTRVENNKKNIILKPDEAYAFDLFFDYEPATISYERNIINGILLDLQPILKPK